MGGFFLYVGFGRDKLSKYVYHLLWIVGLVILGYHMFRAYTKFTIGKSYWVNLIHIFIVAPLLIYIGYHQEKTARYYFEILLMLAFASIGYHGYYALMSFVGGNGIS